MRDVLNSKELRQQYIDEYLADTGRAKYEVDEFLEWMRPRHNHPHWKIFFGRSEGELAEMARRSIARNYVSGLRIYARLEVPATKVIDMTSIIANARMIDVSMPSMISPIETRKTGGGYIVYDHDDASCRASFLEEGARAFAAWLRRYEGAMLAAGLDTDALITFRDAAIKIAEEQRALARLGVLTTFDAGAALSPRWSRKAVEARSGAARLGGAVEAGQG